MDKEQLRKFVNKIFMKSGYPPVKNFAKEFSDGSKLFNIQSLFKEAICLDLL